MLESQVKREEQVLHKLREAFNVEIIPSVVWHATDNTGGGEFIVCQPDDDFFERDLKRAQDSIEEDKIFLTIEKTEFKCPFDFPKIEVTWEEEESSVFWCQYGPYFYYQFEE